MNLLRGGLHAAASLMFFVAVKYMPLADVFAIYFVQPFMLTIMSALFLGDRVGWRRWTAIIVGFGGAMIVIQPSWAIFGRSEEHTSELQSLMRISYAVFCLQKKKT